MAYWGIAYAWGPNINNMEIEPAQIAKAEFAIRLAKLHAKDCTALERDLIDALSTRYATPVPSRNILGVAEAMVAGEIEYRKGNFDQALACQRSDVRIDRSCYCRLESTD